MNEHMIEAALEYLKLGYRPIPVVPGTKRAAIKWKAYQESAPTPQEVEQWFGRGDAGIALLTGNGVVVVDVDDHALLDDVIAHSGDTPMRCCTPSGGQHLYYRTRAGVHYGNAVRIHDKPLDLRCEGAYVVVPPSVNAEGVPYRWLGQVLPVSELPLPRVSWLRERQPVRKMQLIEVSPEQDFMERRALAWLAHVEGAVSGANGHNATMRVAGKLIQYFRLDFERAFRCIKVWNEHCEPEWSDAELRHKLESAVKNLPRYT